MLFYFSRNNMSEEDIQDIDQCSRAGGVLRFCLVPSRHPPVHDH